MGEASQPIAGRTNVSGIMSEIDFDMVMEHLSDPKGDSVKVTMSRKFLRFKYYRASGNAQVYGYREGGVSEARRTIYSRDMNGVVHSSKKQIDKETDT